MTRLMPARLCGWFHNDYQTFNILTVDGIWHRISPANVPTKALDVFDQLTEAGANISIYPYLGNFNQQFRFQAAGSNRGSELCFDIDAKYTVNSANLLQWSCKANVSTN
ncbi:RICIN domain-containing protein [Pseudoalteromonas mariniglutinosa]|uniref:RICIN domain-containing protein n=1 Tax=Pseudoalteromonas mariniglutinosa TaxID=206042 RepID=UPI00384E9DB6